MLRVAVSVKNPLAPFALHQTKRRRTLHRVRHRARPMVEMTGPGNARPYYTL